jgi:hypothetical protein
LSVAPLATSALTFAWSSNNTVLTVTPTELAYATGTTPSGTAAQAYTVALTTGAKDVAGNPISSKYVSTFSTLKRITQTLSPSTVAVHDSYGAATGLGSLAECSSNVQLGSWSGKVSSGTRYGLIVFNTSTMGTASTVSTIESATFGGSQSTPTASFYTSGSVVLERLDYEPLDNSTVLATATAKLGTMCSSYVASPKLNVLTTFASDFTAGNQNLLYRIGPAGSANDENAYFSCTGFTLSVIYLSR